MGRNGDLVRAWHDAAMFGRLDDLLALTHPEFVMTEASVLPGAVRVEGREGLRSYAYGWARNWSEQEFVENALVELPPDRVAVDYTLRLRGLRSEIWVEHRWSYLFEIRDGLIARDDGFQSMEEIPGLPGSDRR